jgi:hypothetical protein
MPVVQRYEQHVQADPIPGVRNTAAETPTSTGAGLADAQGQQAETIGRLGSTVANLAGQQLEEERKRNDELVNLAAQNALGKVAADISTAAQAVKGKDSLTLPDTTTEAFNTAADTIAGTLVNDRQREVFAKARSQHDLNLYATVGRHVSQEMQSYRASELESAIDLGISAVAANALDPRRGKEELQQIVDAVTTQGPALGWGEQELADKLAKVKSVAHVAVVERLVENNQPANARIYYEETQTEIDGTKRGNLEKLLDKAGTLGDAQRAADAIITAGGTPEEQDKALKAIKDPETRKEATSLVEHEQAKQEHRARVADENLLDSVFARLMKNGGDLRSITPAEKLKLGSHLPGLKNFSDDLARGVPRVSDKNTYYTMLDQAENYPTNFATLNLRPLMLKLSPEDYDHLDRTQRAIRAGNKKGADVELDDYRTEQTVMKSALQLAGIDPTPKDDDQVGLDRVARFQTLLAAEARRVQADTKKKIGNADLESIANRILARQIVDEGWFYDSKRSLGTATPADIPPADLTQIMDSLRRAGQPTTPENALQIWLRAQARKGAQ